MNDDFVYMNTNRIHNSKHIMNINIKVLIQGKLSKNLNAQTKIFKKFNSVLSSEEQISIIADSTSSSEKIILKELIEQTTLIPFTKNTNKSFVSTLNETNYITLNQDQLNFLSKEKGDLELTKNPDFELITEVLNVTNNINEFK